MDSSPAPERSTDETGTNPEGLIPLRRRRRRRLGNDGRRPAPRPARTKPTAYTTNRRETHGLHHLATPQRPSEAWETADSAGGD